MYVMDFRQVTCQKVQKIVKGLFFMDNYDQLNEILVYLFDHALDIERNFLIRDTFKDISVNDMHVFNAIGLFHCGFEEHIPFEPVR